MPAPDELRAAHVPLSYWTRGAGDIVIAGAATIDTSNLSVSGFNMPVGARIEAVIQAGALGIDEADRPPEMALLRAGSLHVTSSGSLRVTGNRVLVIVVAGDATIEGGIDGRATMSLAGPGGSDSGGVGRGDRGDTPFGSDRHSGGGGAGLGTDGARGGSVDCNLCTFGDADGGQGGALVGDAEQTFLYAGSAGGRADNCESDGGAGGGGIQITALTRIEHSGWIAVDGGGGQEGQDCTIVTTVQGAGGGGGSGGAIFLEAPQVIASGVLSANGGAGGAGFPGTPGSDGIMGVSAASGGNSTGSESQDGGDGGASNVAPLVGDGWNNQSDGNAGGGGGSVGRITVDAPSFTSSGTISPPAVNL